MAYRVAHKLVASVAREAAGELYETLMSNNRFFEEWKRLNPGLNKKQLEARFIAKNSFRMIDFAKATLAELLHRPDTSAQVKDEIYKALVLHNSVPVGKGRQEAVNIVNREMLKSQS
jgi:hypothetical protein